MDAIVESMKKTTDENNVTKSWFYKLIVLLSITIEIQHYPQYHICIQQILYQDSTYLSDSLYLWDLCNANMRYDDSLLYTIISNLG